MTQQFLHGADVITRQQQVGGKRMAQRVWRRGLVDADFMQRTLEGTLKVGVHHVVAASSRAARVW